MNTDNEITPIYFTIGQVSKMLHLPESLLRFWEKEFDILKPRKTNKGIRKYSKNDIDTIKMIYQLVKVEGFTLDGAKEKIKNNHQIKYKTEIIENLKDIKHFLLQLKKQL